MPNWSSNQLWIRGTKKDVDAIEALIGDKFDFNVLIPYPKHFEEMDKAARDAEAAGVEWDKRPKDGYNSGGYDWCVANWGTKWNARDAQVTRSSPNGMDVIFDTAWSPPIPIIEELSRRFPNVEFTIAYVDEGGGFDAETDFKGGKELETRDRLPKGTQSEE